MSRDQTQNSALIAGRSDLIEYFEAGCKMSGHRGVGTEHEAFGIWRDSLSPISYDGERGLETLFQLLEADGEWVSQLDRNRTMALVRSDGTAITLEPGGQLELSGRVTRTLQETDEELHDYQTRLESLSDDLGITWLCLGYHPLSRIEDIPWMPKSRYDLMAPHLLSRGDLAEHMMKATCTVQANFDYTSEQDWAEMVHLGVRISPIVSAIFANSSLREGRPNGYTSFRCHVWTRTDPDRCGTPPFMLEGPPTFEQYVDYLRGVPMIFIVREGRYESVCCAPFGEFLDSGYEAYRATMGDWQLHVSTAFPDVRTKQFVEVRGADGGDRDQILAVPALWKGIFYDSDARLAADELIGALAPDQHQQLYDDVCRHGLGARWRGRPLLDTARELTEIAVAGLDRQADGGDSESRYLDAVCERLDRGESPADQMRRVAERANGDPRVLLDLLACR